MKKSLTTWQILGFVFTSVAGVLLHFLFKWTGESIVVAPFSAINESIWEHMKILFFPMFIFALIESKNAWNNFWCVKFIGIVFGITLIPTLYYSINGIFEITPDWVNIATFFVTTAIVYIVETWLFKKDIINCESQANALFILWMIALVFVIFTFTPPHIPLFEDPIIGNYGYIR